MSTIDDDDPANARRRGIAGGSFDGPPGRAADSGTDVWRRILFTLGALFVFRFGAHLPVPGVDVSAVRQLFAEPASRVLGPFDFLAGNPIREVSIFALGIMPYVSAWVIVELVARTIPRLSKLIDGRTAERTRLNQYARILTVVLAAIQAVGVVAALKGTPGFVILPNQIFDATTVVTMTAGAVFLTWLAEQISARGLGNGALVILAFEAAGGLRHAATSFIAMDRDGDLEAATLLAPLAMTVAALALVVFVERGERRRPVYDRAPEIGLGEPSDESRGRQAVNPACLMPALAAAVFVAPLGRSIAAIAGGDMTATGFLGSPYAFPFLDGALIIVFAFYFTSSIIDPSKEDQKRARSDGHRPGNESAKSAARPLHGVHYALVAAYIVAVCVGPLLFYYSTHFPFVLSGFHIFLLAWVAQRILERMQPLLRQLHRREPTIADAGPPPA